MKKFLFFIFFLFLITIVMIISNCEYFTLLSQKEWAELSDKEDDVIIYVGGWYTPGLNYPCYWEITEDHEDRIDLEMIESSCRVNSIYVTGENVYTCGYQVISLYQRACYWINRKAYLLEQESPTANAVAYDIIVKNGIIFITGEDNGNACYWVNQDKIDLNMEEANSIFIQQIGSSKHITYIGGSNLSQACFYKDGIINYLPTPNSTVNSICVIGKNVYTCGYANAMYAPLWINNELKELSGGVEGNSIFISGEDIYVAGVTGTPNACYWKNGKYHLLSSNTDSEALSIFVFNDKAYISGIDNPSNPYACYWVDGEIHYLYTSNDSTGSCIYVVPGNKK